MDKSTSEYPHWKNLDILQIILSTEITHKNYLLPWASPYFKIARRLKIEMIRYI